MKNELKPIIKRINELFITERKKYIIQNEDGTYTWLSVTEENNVKKFHDYMVEAHLKQSRTYGIFSGSMLTKFITFDIDIPSHELVHSIYKVLNGIGIDSKYIHTSWSGSKGYHVDIYFSNPISITNIKTLYNYVIFELKERKNDSEIHNIIELRPSPNQGLKLPLGVNRKNKDPLYNTCWYVDPNNYMQIIPNVNYILEIEQINSNQMIKIVNNLPIINYNATNTSSANKENLSNDQKVQYTNMSIHSLKLLDENGLTKPGTRNHSLCKLAIYYKELQLSSAQCETRLIEWMNNQDTQFYKTPLHTCYEEIKRIVNGVYSKNIPLKHGKTEINFTKNELMNLREIGGAERKTLYYLFIHSKRYADENGEFFMTYQQLIEAGNYSNTTAINHIKGLEKQKALEVTRSPLYFNGEKPRNLPNKYKLINLDFKMIKNEENDSVTKTIHSISSYHTVAQNIINELFTYAEWLSDYHAI